jgi:threonine dehydratase
MGAVPTPLVPAPATLADGRELWLKREDEHELGAFKWRGAVPVIESLAAADHHTVVTASTGNHGAAVAWAAGRCGVKSTVFAPADASATKLALLESLSATIRLVEGDLDFAKEEARRFAVRERLPFFEDGAEPLQYEGYAQIAIELLGAASSARRCRHPRRKRCPRRWCRLHPRNTLPEHGPHRRRRQGDARDGR